VPRPAERRTQAERRELSERRVIETAVSLIADHGTRAATLARVGEAAGYSRGIVTHHFGTRDRLLREVVQHAAGQVDAPAYAGDGLLQLRNTIRAYLEDIAAETPSARAQHRWAADRAGAQVAVLDGASHWWPSENPKPVAGALTKFLQALEN
jgi:AcrR family transcriptional regulator